MKFPGLVVCNRQNELFIRPQDWYQTKFSNFLLTAYFASYLGEKVSEWQNGDVGYSDKKESGTVAKRKGVTACYFYEHIKFGGKNISTNCAVI